MGGGTVGYNWQIGKSPYLVGLEGEYGYLGQKGGKTDPNAATWNAQTKRSDEASDNSQSSTSIGADYGYGLVGGRLGYALDRSLIYIKSGAVFTTVNSSWSNTAYGENGTSNKATTTGYALGAGFEYSLPFKYFTNVSVKTEYLYFGIPTATTIITPPDNDEDGYPPDSVTHTQTTSGIHTAKIGVNYKF
jgi:outer membrane immunogenic protein